jgi:hypothetical protein
MIKIITQCASRKTIENPNKTSMVNFNTVQPLNDRVDQWLASLNKQIFTTTAWNLYTGHFYQILNKAIAKLPQPVEKCIISTGYGVLYENDKVTDYMVTYANHIDEPTKINQLKGVDFKEWHKTLCKKRNVTPIEDWVNKDDIVIVLLGAEYLKIVQEDIQKIYDKLENKDNFIMISIGSATNLPNQLPIDASWRKWLGGPQNVMMPNTLSKILDDNLSLNFTELNNHFTSIYQPQAIASDIKISDNDVVDYIKKNPTLSKGQILDKFRKEGKSCSSGRMDRLYSSLQKDK